MTTQAGITTPGTRRRAGFVLPLVIIATLLVATVAGAAQFAAWRATRAARQAFNGERALLSADESIAYTVANWNADAFARTAIGRRSISVVRTSTGDGVDVSVTRSAPLIAWVDVAATSQTSGAPSRARRRAGRALFLEPPALPLPAALVALSPVALRGTAFVSGIDVAATNDECGPWRDTASVAGLHNRVHRIDSTVAITGAPPIATLVDTTRDRAAFDAAWPLLALRATPRQLTPNAPLPNGPAWRAILVHDSATIQLTGASQHDGLVVIDGDLVLRGSLTVRGLLVVRGAVDATAGRLDIDGALVIYAPNGATSSLGSNTSVRYSQCALRQALAAVALPKNQPFRLWSERD